MKRGSTAVAYGQPLRRQTSASLMACVHAQVHHDPLLVDMGQKGNPYTPVLSTGHHVIASHGPTRMLQCDYQRRFYRPPECTG
jgi:mitochondrial fission protein ELM1